MPTAAQRQREAALSRLTQNQNSKEAMAAIESKQASTSTNADAEWEDGAFSDDDDSDDEDSALKMDGQDNWTQNFCATCDTLIEPGQGLIAKNDDAPLHSPTSSVSRAGSSGLKSKSGTIKARPMSSEGATAGPVKRANSAGRIHTVAAGNTSNFGPSKRTGSAGSRLNALSELKPTTKLHDTVKGKTNDASSTGTRSPVNSRRNSNVSVRSSNSNGQTATHSSGSSSPSQADTTLPRVKRTGLLGSLTPAALKQQEELEVAKSKAPAALYCSERCRQIDEQRSAGLGELVYYLQQPSSPANTAGWHSGHSSYGAWSARASNSNMAAMLMTSALPPSASNLGALTPESDCPCAECMDKHSASGTVPSGASDTTEGTNSYQYGSRGHKQRTTSGRIVTPQNLYPPGVQQGGNVDYFGNAANVVRRSQQYANRSRSHRDSISQAGTESSTRSSDSGSEIWEPRTRTTTETQATRDRASSSASESVTPDNGRGSTTTGTVTPDGALGSTAIDASRLHGLRSLSVLYAASSVDAPLSTSQASTTSPLRLLRHGKHSGLASVDVSSDVATSPQPYASSLLSRSMASERTDDGESSGFTTIALQQPATAATSERGQRAFSSTVDTRGLSNQAPGRITDSPAPFERSRSDSSASALDALKNAQARASMFAKSTDDEARQTSTSSEQTASSGSGWLRNSISAAWNTIRGSGPVATSEEPRAQLQRPTTKRGDVPSFVNEIGQGGIPGESEDREEQPSAKTAVSADGNPSIADLAAERRLRKAERERANRHQRSKDVSILPPLLGVARPASSVNLHHHGTTAFPGATRTHRTHSTTSSRSDATAPDSPLLMPVRSTTPGFNRGQRNNSFVGMQDYGTSPGRLAHIGAASFGTSPRRAGLGWGALTPLGPPAVDVRTGRPQPPLSTHRHAGHPQHTVGGPGAHHHHVHHQHGGGHHQHQHQHHAGPHKAHHGTLSLGGNVGLLGTHPHGNGAIPGRHATTPVRMSTPRVPEHGGEMSAAQLLGLEDGPTTSSEHVIMDGTQSRSFHRRSSMLAAGPPPRPQSVNQIRVHGPPSRSHTPSNAGSTTSMRKTSFGEDGTGLQRTLKMYPVLDVPNRQPTHDRYDAGWNLGNDGISHLLPTSSQGSMDQQQPAPSGTSVDHAHQQQTRKKLFYFDTT